MDFLKKLLDRFLIFGEVKFAFEKRAKIFEHCPNTHDNYLRLFRTPLELSRKSIDNFSKTALEFEEILEENMKKFLYIIAAVLAFTSLYGCGNNSTSETEKAKETVDSFFAALKDADFKTAADYVSSEEQEQMRNTEWHDDFEREFMETYLSKISSKYISGEIEKDKTEGSLMYEFKSMDMGEYVNKVGLNNPLIEGGAPKIKDVDVDGIHMVELEKSVFLKKEGDKWLIANVNEVMNAIMEFKAGE